MVDIELGLVSLVATILAPIVVAQIDIGTGKLDPRTRHPVEVEQLNHSRNQQTHTDAVNEIGVGTVVAVRQGSPAVPVVRAEVFIERFRTTAIEQDEGPANGDDMHCLPQPVQKKDILSEHDTPGSLHTNLGIRIAAEPERV